jgi:hypothetical protein
MWGNMTPAAMLVTMCFFLQKKEENVTTASKIYPYYVMNNGTMYYGSYNVFLQYIEVVVVLSLQQTRANILRITSSYSKNTSKITSSYSKNTSEQTTEAEQKNCGAVVMCC